jgi:hypothetical protein
MRRHRFGRRLMRDGIQCAWYEGLPWASGVWSCHVVVADMEMLVEACHSRGMRLILDLVGIQPIFLEVLWKNFTPACSSADRETNI